MKYFIISVLIACLISLTNEINYRFPRYMRQPPCPLEWDLGPCTCGGLPGGATIDCSNITNGEELGKIFKSSPMQMNMRGIEIHGSKSLTDLPDDVFGTHTISLFLLDGNQIQNVGKKAFSGSEESTDLIILSNNKISEFPFEIISSMTSLQILNLANNKITKISEDAFPVSNVPVIDLSGNLIESIGKNAFTKLSNLQKLDLSGNKLTTLAEKIFPNGQSTNPMGLLNFANNSISQIEDPAFSDVQIATLDLSNNQLKFLKESVFAPFLKADHVMQKISLDGNPIDCENKNMEWIKNIPKEALTKLEGFQCEI